MKGLALDPGEKVGWNTFTIKRGHLHIPGYGITPQKPLALQLHRASDPLYLPRFDVVVMEDWVLTAFGAKVSVGSDMPSSQFIGMVRLSYWQNYHRRQAFKLEVQPAKRLNTGKLALQDDSRVDYAVIRQIIDNAPAAHDDSHYVSSLLHTVAYYHRHHR
jgi:hypothetical protein